MKVLYDPYSKGPSEHFVSEVPGSVVVFSYWSVFVNFITGLCPRWVKKRNISFPISGWLCAPEAGMRAGSPALLLWKAATIRPSLHGASSVVQEGRDGGPGNSTKLYGYMYLPHLYTSSLITPSSNFHLECLINFLLTPWTIHCCSRPRSLDSKPAFPLGNSILDLISEPWNERAGCLLEHWGLWNWHQFLSHISMSPSMLFPSNTECPSQRLCWLALNPYCKAFLKWYHVTKTFLILTVLFKPLEPFIRIICAFWLLSLASKAAINILRL